MGNSSYCVETNWKQVNRLVDWQTEVIINNILNAIFLLLVGVSKRMTQCVELHCTNPINRLVKDTACHLI